VILGVIALTAMVVDYLAHPDNAKAPAYEGELDHIVSDLPDNDEVLCFGCQYIPSSADPTTLIPDNSTNTEFTTILGNPEFLNKTKFYRYGKLVPTAEVLEKVGFY